MLSEKTQAQKPQKRTAATQENIMSQHFASPENNENTADEISSKLSEIESRLMRRIFHLEKVVSRFQDVDWELWPYGATLRVNQTDSVNNGKTCIFVDHDYSRDGQCLLKVNIDGIIFKYPPAFLSPISHGQQSEIVSENKATSGSEPSQPQDAIAPEKPVLSIEAIAKGLGSAIAFIKIGKRDTAATSLKTAISKHGKENVLSAIETLDPSVSGALKSLVD